MVQIGSWKKRVNHLWLVCCEIKAYLLFERGVNQITLGFSTLNLVCIQYFCQIWQPSHSWWPRCHWLPSGSFQMFSGHDIEWLGYEPFGEYVDITANVMKYMQVRVMSAHKVLISPWNLKILEPLWFDINSTTRLYWFQRRKILPQHANLHNVHPKNPRTLINAR